MREELLVPPEWKEGHRNPCRPATSWSSHSCACQLLVIKDFAVKTSRLDSCTGFQQARQQTSHAPGMPPLYKPVIFGSLTRGGRGDKMNLPIPQQLGTPVDDPRDFRQLPWVLLRTYRTGSCCINQGQSSISGNMPCHLSLAVATLSTRSTCCIY